MKKGKYLFLLLIVVSFFWINSCEESITVPVATRVKFDVVVIDTSGYYGYIIGQEQFLIDSATIFLSSITYDKYYSVLSNSSGFAGFDGLIPDRYNITVTKKIQLEVDGLPVEKMFNGQIQNISFYEPENYDTVFVRWSGLSSLIISELYYCGAPPGPNRVPTYYHDQFTEIYNNSDRVVYLDSLIVADLDYGHATEEYIYCVHAYMFPGSGKDYPIQPGECIVLAQDAIEHTLIVPSSVDLRNADFEYYVADKPDVDNPDVPNMIPLHHKYGNDVLYSVFNDAVVILRVDDPYAGGYSEFDLLKIPKDKVLDGVDYRDNLMEIDHKRLDESIDGGLTGGIEAYKSKSVQRRIDKIVDGRVVLVDNNNSSVDFIVLDHPTPGTVLDSDGGK